MDLNLARFYLPTHLHTCILPHYHCIYHFFLMYLITISICHNMHGTELNKKRASEQLGTFLDCLTQCVQTEDTNQGVF